MVTSGIDRIVPVLMFMPEKPCSFLAAIKISFLLKVNAVLVSVSCVLNVVDITVATRIAGIRHLTLENTVFLLNNGGCIWKN